MLSAYLLRSALSECSCSIDDDKLLATQTCSSVLMPDPIYWDQAPGLICSLIRELPAAARCSSWTGRDRGAAQGACQAGVACCC